MTAIAATFADFRPVKSRGVYQIILEVPAERANDALIALGGLPLFGSEQWVGVAPLVGKPQAEQQPSPPPSPEKAKERRPFHTLPRSQQAALLIRDERFREWWFDHPNGSEADADASIKDALNIASKRELDQPGDPADWWDGTVKSYFETSGLSTWERPA